MFHGDKTSASFIHRGECTGRHLVLIKMTFGCRRKSGLLHWVRPKIDTRTAEVFQKECK